MAYAEPNLPSAATLTTTLYYATQAALSTSRLPLGTGRAPTGDETLITLSPFSLAQASYASTPFDNVIPQDAIDSRPAPWSCPL